MKILLCIVLFFAIQAHAGSTDLGYGLTRSSSTLSNRLKINFSLSPEDRLSVNFKSTDSTSQLSDPESSSIRAHYRHTTASDFVFSATLKASDDFYFYNTGTFGFRTVLPFDEDLNFQLAVERGRKTYSKIGAETIDQSGWALGFDYKLSRVLSMGGEYSSIHYESSAFQSRRALRGQKIANSDISSTVGGLYGKSFSAFLEAEWSALILGLALGQDQYAIGGSSINTTEFYSDFDFNEDWSGELFISNGKSEGSTTSSSTIGAGLTIRF